MSRLLVPSYGPSDWRRLLADPGRQWKSKRSAYEAAVAWESARRTARGLPAAIATVLDGAAAFRDAQLILGVPEHQVQLDGGGHSSQTDFWALLDSPSIGLVSAAIEAKAGESFDVLTAEWLAKKKANSGKPARLRQLCRILGISEADACSCRYQLLHRPAVAILEAKRFRLREALFLVQAFSDAAETTDNADSFQDYKHWARLLGHSAIPGALHDVGVRDGVRLWIGWSDSATASERSVRDAV